MSSSNAEFARAADRWRKAKSLAPSSCPLNPEPWSESKVCLVAGKVTQRLAEYDIWVQGSVKQEVEKMARERGVSVSTVKKDVRNSGHTVDAMLKYLGHEKLWTIVILLLVYIQRQKLDDMESKLLPDLIPQPKRYYNRIFESRAVPDILRTVFCPQPMRRKRRSHWQRRVLMPPKDASLHQLILPSLLARGRLDVTGPDRENLDQVYGE